MCPNIYQNKIVYTSYELKFFIFFGIIHIISAYMTSETAVS